MKFLKAVLILFSASFAFQSCHDSDGRSNQFTYDGKNYSLANALVTLNVDRGKNDDGDSIYLHQVIILDKGFTYDEADFAGAGNLLALYFTGSRPLKLEPGTYTISSQIDSQFDLGGLMAIDYETSASTGTVVSAESGTVKVATFGIGYTFDVDVVLTDAQPVKGFFSGVLHPFHE